jgi:hypothetical protein
MQSVITIIASNPKVYYHTTIFKPDSDGPGDVSYPNTSNFPHLSMHNSTIVSLTEEKVIIRTQVPYVSPFPRDYLKRDFDDDLDESVKPPRKCRPYCRCYDCRMAYRKAMDELEEFDENNMQDTDHTDETNESSSRLSTETPIVDVHRECALPFKALASIDDSIPEIGHEPSDKE